MAAAASPDAATVAARRDLLRPLFESLKMSDFPQTPLGKVEALPSSMTIREAMEVLHARGILSAPIIDAAAPADASWKDKYLGVLDMVKLAVVMLDALEADSPIAEEDEEEAADGAAQRKPLQFHPLSSQFAERPLSDLAENETGWMPFMPIELDATLLDAIVLMGTFRLKRLPVISGPDGDLVNMVTQSSVVALLANNLGELASVTDLTLTELGMATPTKVLSIRSSQPIRDAFRLIREHNVSAVPVLGLSGEMVGNISARHAYYVVTAQNKLRKLAMRAADFLAHGQGDVSGGWNIRSTAIVCHAHDSLGSVIQKLASAHIHRIYLCDEHNRPQRVIALQDVLAQFAGQPAETTCSLL